MLAHLLVICARGSKPSQAPGTSGTLAGPTCACQSSQAPAMQQLCCTAANPCRSSLWCRTADCQTACTVNACNALSEACLQEAPRQQPPCRQQTEPCLQEQKSVHFLHCRKCRAWCARRRTLLTRMEPAVDVAAAALATASCARPSSVDGACDPVSAAGAPAADTTVCVNPLGELDIAQ